MPATPLLPISQIPATPAQSAPLVGSSRSSVEQQPLAGLSASPTSSLTDLPLIFPRRQPASGPAQSEKAKGKQRDWSRGREDTPRQPERGKGRQVTVRFLEGGIVMTAADTQSGKDDSGDGAPDSGDLELWAEEADSIADLKWKIRASRPALARRHLRLIHLGRVLSPTLTLVPYLAQLRDRARALDAPTIVPTNRSDDARVDETVWLQCAVGLELGEGEEESDRSEAMNSAAPLRGFDLLRATAGLSEDDVRTMRRQFHRTRDVDVELDEAAQALEESWIDGTLTTANADAEPASTYSTLLNGLTLSFFFPLLTLFFLKDSEPHSFLGPGRDIDTTGGAVFSRKMQMAIMIALGINLTLGVVMCLS